MYARVNLSSHEWAISSRASVQVDADLCQYVCCPIPNPHSDAWSAAAADTLLSQTAAPAMLRAKKREGLVGGGEGGGGEACSIDLAAENPNSYSSSSTLLTAHTQRHTLSLSASHAHADPSVHTLVLRTCLRPVCQGQPSYKAGEREQEGK